MATRKKNESPEVKEVNTDATESVAVNDPKPEEAVTNQGELPFQNEFIASDGLAELKSHPAFDKAPVLESDEVLLAEKKERAIQAEAESDGSPSEKIINFLKSRNAVTFIRLNDFLKSLYPLPKNNEPFEWQQQTKMKTLRAIIDGMVVNKQIVTSTNSYLQLGKPYWPDDSTGKTHYHHIGSLVIEAKLL